MYGSSANGNGQYLTVNLKPHCAPCYSFCVNSSFSKQTAWLVPHVIKNKEDSAIITWRCNWGHICESDCLYAAVKDKKWSMPASSQSGSQI